MKDLLTGKTILVTGVLNRSSLAFAAAAAAQQAGARTILTWHQRHNTVQAAAADLDPPPPLIPLDVTDPDHLYHLTRRLSRHTDHIDGIIHAIAWAPRPPDHPGFTRAGWDHAGPVLQISTHSLAALTAAALPLLADPASLVALDFDASRAWPGYDWMGVAKAGLEACARYLAAELGERHIRVNLIASGPIRTVASHGEPHFARIAQSWRRRAPLGWDPRDPTPIAQACVTLLSDLLPATTGQILHVDGGAHLRAMDP